MPRLRTTCPSAVRAASIEREIGRANSHASCALRVCSDAVGSSALKSASTRLLLSFPAAIALFFTLAACSEPPPLAHPNVVVILADDLGAGDVGWSGLATDPIATPNLDRLAASGLVLEQYRSAPLCTPARAALLTGRAPARLGLLRNISARDVGGLGLDAPTLAETLATAGYATELVGKWHLGHASESLRPMQRGFQEFVGVLGGWIDYQTHARGKNADWWRDGAATVEEGHATRLLASEAALAIRERDATKPLYLHVAFTAPHAPTSVPPGRSIDEIAGTDPVRRAYALLVDELDRGVGIVLDALDAAGIRGRTLVLFASDNGAPLEYGGSNGTLRGAKGSVYDGALRVPAILSWPGTIAPGRSRVGVNAVDIVPTVCDALGVALAPDEQRDGVSAWLALVHGAPSSLRTSVFAVERADGTSWAAFDGRWKYVEDPDETKSGLYDVLEDPAESRDRSASDSEVRSRLEAELAPWRAFPHMPFVPDETPK